MKLFNPVEFVSNKFGVPYDQILIVTVMFMPIPLSIPMYLMKSPKVRHWYNISIGVFLQLWFYKKDILHSISSTVFTYFFMKFFGRKRSAIWVVVVTFIHLTLTHLYRMFFRYGMWDANDVTIIYMMSMCKYSLVAFAYEDGAKDEKELKSYFLRENRIKDMPTFVELFGYIFFFPTCIAGPSFNFKDYIDFIHLRGVYKNMSFWKNFKNGMFYMGLNVITTVSYLLFSNTLALSYVGTVEYGQKSLLYKYFYLFGGMMMVRFKYYSAWLLSYCAFIIVGTAYTERPKNTKLPVSERNPMISNYEKGCFGDIFDCEFGINPKTKIVSWNTTVHIWLKYNVFVRVVNLDNKLFKNNYKLASLITFMLSAFWHGWYPCYYIFFFSMYIYQTANEVFDKIGVYKWIREKDYDNLYDWITDEGFFRRAIKSLPMFFFTQYMVNGLGTIIFNLRFDLFVQFMKNVHYTPFIFVVVLYVSSKFLIKYTKGNRKVAFQSDSEDVSKSDEDMKKKKL